MIHSVQSHLGEVVFVELPEAGATVAAGGSFGNVESVKATSDVNSPVSGEVVEVNSKLSETPGLVRTYGCRQCHFLFGAKVVSLSPCLLVMVIVCFVMAVAIMSPSCAWYSSLDCICRSTQARTRRGG
jgi:hypothetical protein